jgi:hypothetical protein
VREVLFFFFFGGIMAVIGVGMAYNSSGPKLFKSAEVKGKKIQGCHLADDNAHLLCPKNHPFHWMRAKDDMVCYECGKFIEKGTIEFDCSICTNDEDHPHCPDCDLHLNSYGLQ